MFEVIYTIFPISFSTVVDLENKISNIPSNIAYYQLISIDCNSLVSPIHTINASLLYGILSQVCGGKRFLFFLTSDSERTVVVRAVGLPGGRRPGPAPSQWLPETGTVQLGPSWRSSWRSAGERAMRRCQGVSLYISLYNAYMLHFTNYSVVISYFY